MSAICFPGERPLLARSGHSLVSRLGPCTEDDIYGVENLQRLVVAIVQKTSRSHPLQRLNKPINAAFATVLKLRLNPTTAADVSEVTGSVSCETANIVKM